MKHRSDFRKLKLSALAAVLFVVVCPLAALAADLTGTWSCNDGGLYYLRQVGSTVWWYGERAPTHPGWTNVAYGTVAGNNVVLFWADVPKGTATGSGVLVLKINSNNEFIAQNKFGSGFGGSTWNR